MAASGPSLEPIRGYPTIAINDAWRMLPWADVLYATDNKWWHHHQGVPEFQGERWSTHDPSDEDSPDWKGIIGPKWHIHCVIGKRCHMTREGKHLEEPDGFSLEPDLLNYGDNSGFAAINLAILFGCTTIVLTGFDMHSPRGKHHFFGDHPAPIGQAARPPYARRIEMFENAAKKLPPHIRIINATPGTHLTCFEMMETNDALALLDQTDCRMDAAQAR